MQALDRSAWEAIRADNVRIAALAVELQSALDSGCCQHCGAPFHRDEFPGVMVVSFTCGHGPAPAPEFTPALTDSQRARLRLPVSA